MLSLSGQGAAPAAATPFDYNTVKERGAYLPAAPEAAPAPEETDTDTTPAPTAKSSGFGMSNEDMFNMGMALLAGKSQYGLQNLGEAGLTMAKMRAERNRQLADISHLQAQTRQANAYADILPEKGAMFSARTQALLSAVPPAQQAAAKQLQFLAKTASAKADALRRVNPFDPSAAQYDAQAAQYEDKIRAMATGSGAGVGTMAPAAPVSLPQGVQVERIAGT
jgi:hypothetical protein